MKFEVKIMKARQRAFSDLCQSIFFLRLVMLIKGKC